MKTDISFYIHIPFCIKKCFYCDFPSFSGCESIFEDYVDVLIKELTFYKQEYSQYRIHTIFLGGGTPTVLPAKQLGRIMDTVFSNYNVANDAEITIEANPGTINLSIDKELIAMDINRISLGVQAFQNRLLSSLGRIHTVETFLKNYLELRDVGFRNINVDLMFSLPEQSLLDWKSTLEAMTALQADHISCYSLIIEQGTKFQQYYDNGLLHLPEEQLDRQMYELAKKYLTQSGYEQYEISNFSKPDMQCRHNLVYWRDEEYIGFGLSAHSFFNLERFHNTGDLRKYLSCKNKIPSLREEIEKLALKDQYAEFMFLGLRMMQGICTAHFQKRFGQSVWEIYGDVLDKLQEQKLICQQDGRIMLTSRGIDISNLVFTEFLL